MPRMPGALWRPLPHNGSRMSRWDILCWHTMVGSLMGTDSYFRGMAPGGTSSHFGTGPDGDIIQWVDTAYLAWANKDGSPRIISVETADVGPGFPKWNLNDGGAVPAWTPQQVEAHAQIAAWVAETHDIPPVLIPDSKPGRRGNGYHRQGVPGYKVAGGETWSSAYGKVCPGARRIAQIPQVLARAKQIAGGATNPVPEDDMAQVPQAEWDAVVKALTEPVINGKTLPSALRELHQTFFVTEHNRAGVPEDAAYPTARAIHLLRFADGNAQALRQEVAALRALVATQQGVDPDELERIIREAIAESVVQVDVNVSGGDEQPPASA